MSASSGWADMQTAINGSHLVPKCPEKLTPADGIEIHTFRGHELSQEMSEKIISFLANNYILTSGNTIQVSITNLKNMRSLGCYFVIATRNKEVVGTIICYPITFHNGLARVETCKSFDIDDIDQLDVDKFSVDPPSNDNIVKGSYTTCLCIKQGERKNNLAMVLIRETMIRGYQDDIYHGYYLTSNKRHDCSVVLKSWFKPLDFPISVRSGFLPRNSGVRDRLACEHRLPYPYSYSRLSDSVNLDESRKHHQLMTEWFNSDTYHYAPKIDEWQLHIEHFLTFVVKKGQKSMAIFMLFINPVFIKEAKKVVIIANLSFLVIEPNATAEERRDVLKTIAHAAKVLGTAILCGYVVGDMNKRLIDDFKPYISSMVRNLEMYNFNVTIDDVCKLYPIIF